MNDEIFAKMVCKLAKAIKELSFEVSNPSYARELANEVISMSEGIKNDRK